VRDKLSEYKKKLRQIYLSKRNNMSSEEIKFKSESICKQILNSKEYTKASQLFCYYPLVNEVDILPVVKQGLRDGKVLCFPKVLNKTTIVFYQIKSLDDFVKGSFNVLEPVTTKEVNVNVNTLMIVPGLVFDEENYRIGYGGGYYDRYIMQSRSEIHEFTTIGVCYFWQKTKLIQKDTYDQKLTRIINELS